MYRERQLLQELKAQRATCRHGLDSGQVSLNPGVNMGILLHDVQADPMDNTSAGACTHCMECTVNKGGLLAPLQLTLSELEEKGLRLLLLGNIVTEGDTKQIVLVSRATWPVHWTLVHKADSVDDRHGEAIGDSWLNDSSQVRGPVQ